MKKQLFIGSVVIAGSLFTTIQASANTINIQGTQKQEPTQVISQDQNTNDQVQDFQLQSSTNPSNNSQELTVLNKSNVAPVVFDARKYPINDPRNKHFTGVYYGFHWTNGRRHQLCKNTDAQSETLS